MTRHWLTAAGLAAAAAWLLGRRPRPAGAVGAHAWLVPADQARREARWTAHALCHHSEAKPGQPERGTSRPAHAGKGR